MMFMSLRDFNNAAGTLGSGAFLTSITADGVRCSAASAYLTPAVLARSNLTVLTRAHVARITISDKHAAGVEFVSGARVVARREVLLCAGAIGSPHLLMLSGIGPAEHLREHSIDVIEDLRAVGQHLKDVRHNQLAQLYGSDNATHSTLPREHYRCVLLIRRRRGTGCSSASSVRCTRSLNGSMPAADR